MTPEDRQGLLAAVPEAFVTRDRAFHALGGQLADAARSGNRDEQLRLYGQLRRPVPSVTRCTPATDFPSLPNLRPSLGPIDDPAADSV